jgi:hypothetical protein
MAPAMTLTIPQAYRNLYRATLRATLYSSPARFIIRNRLRSAFRAPPSKQPYPFDPSRISRTLLFLRSAAESPNLERKVVKNLVRVWGERERLLKQSKQTRVLKDNVEFRERAWEEFEEGVRGLERTLGVGFG